MDGMNIQWISDEVAWVESRSSPGNWHMVDIDAGTCQCRGYEIRKDCAHLEEVTQQASLADNLRSEEASRRQGELRMPTVYTARYFSQDLLASGEIVPVGVSIKKPLIPLGYELNHYVKALMPEKGLLGEWNDFCPNMWHKFNREGPERIARTLAGISDQHDGKPIALLCYEDTTKKRGHKCHRPIIQLWWEITFEMEVPEITNDGEVIPLGKLSKQAMPKVPRDY